MIRFIIALFVVTGYCNESCGKSYDHPAYGIMYSGKRTYRGAIACPPEMPLGTEVYLPGMGKFICEDRGGGIEGDRLDIWFRSCEKAIEWGRQEIRGVAIIGGER